MCSATILIWVCNFFHLCSKRVTFRIISHFTWHFYFDMQKTNFGVSFLSCGPLKAILTRWVFWHVPRYIMSKDSIMHSHINVWSTWIPYNSFISEALLLFLTVAIEVRLFHDSNTLHCDLLPFLEDHIKVTTQNILST